MCDAPWVRAVECVDGGFPVPDHRTAAVLDPAAHVQESSYVEMSQFADDLRGQQHRRVEHEGDDLTFVNLISARQKHNCLLKYESRINVIIIVMRQQCQACSEFRYFGPLQ